MNEKHLDARLYVGKGSLREPPCPELAGGSRTYTLELEGAEPGHSRLTVR